MQNLTQKQDYLSKQILDQGYDPEQFQDYMLTHSNKQLDLNLWTLSELKVFVTKYKNKVKNGEASEQLGQIQQKGKQQGIDQGNKSKLMRGEQDAQGEHRLVNIQNLKSQEMTKPNKSSSSNSVNSSLYKHFNIVKKSQMPELYILAHNKKKPFQVSIRTYTKTVPNNIFKSTYIQYVITTSENWQVKRRFTDFVWLRAYLEKKYQGLPIPPIPQKTTLRSFDEKHVDYRMIMFQRFLNTCVQIPQICSDSVLEIFLRATEQYFSQNKRKLQQKLDNNIGSSELQSILGNDLVLLDQFSVPPHVSNFYKQYSAKLTQIGSHMNMLLQNLHKVQGDLSIISSTYQQMSTLIEPTISSSSLTTVLQQFCNNFSAHISKTADFIKHSFYAQWNYESMYITNLHASLSKIQKQQANFAQKYKNSFLKISQQEGSTYTNSMQPNKLIKQCQIVKQEYRIKLSHIIRQMRRYQECEMKLLAGQWVAGIKDFIKDVIGDWMISCTDGMMKGMGIVEGRKLVEVQYIKKS